MYNWARTIAQFAVLPNPEMQKWLSVFTLIAIKVTRSCKCDSENEKNKKKIQFQQLRVSKQLIKTNESFKSSFTWLLRTNVDVG